MCTADFTNADVDILYIDVCRRHGNTYERNALSLNGFCEALLLIARKVGGTGAKESASCSSGSSLTSLTALEFLLNQCEKETVGR